MTDVVSLALIAAVFVVAGLVKGLVGVGLPAVSVGLLTATIGLTEAMALVTLPAFITNIWQASSGPHGAALARRLWPFLILAGLTVWIGTMILSNTDAYLLSALLGVLLFLQGAAGSRGFTIRVPRHRETGTGLTFGTVNGVLTGMTGAFSFPGLLYLQAIGLNKDELIQAMGMLFAISSAALALSLGANGLIDAQKLTVSALAMVPVGIGLVAGVRIRHGLDETRFRRVFHISLMVLGLWIVIRALWLS